MLSLLTQAFPKQSTLLLEQAACSESSLSSNYLSRKGQHQHLGLPHLQESCTVISTVSLSWSPALACLGTGVRASSSFLSPHSPLAELPANQGYMGSLIPKRWEAGTSSNHAQEIICVDTSFLSILPVHLYYYIYRDNFSWSCELIWEQCLVSAEPTDKNTDGSFNNKYCLS